MTTNDLIRKKARKLKHILWKGEMVVPFRYLIKDPSSLYQSQKHNQPQLVFSELLKCFGNTLIREHPWLSASAEYTSQT